MLAQFPCFLIILLHFGSFCLCFDHFASCWLIFLGKEFLKLLPEYASKCDGEGNMHDTAMLYGAVGGVNYEGKCELIGEYFPSSGTGQVNMIFPV